MNNKNDVIVELANSDELYSVAMRVRREVFVEEMGIPENKEFDGNDHCSAQIVAYIIDEDKVKPIGTMRVRFFADFVKFERMAVVKDFRKTNVADKIMHYGFDYASKKGYREVYGMCKQELLSRWQECGYEEIKEVASVEQNGMILVPITRKLPKDVKAINMHSDPGLLTAQEGHWYDEKNDKKRDCAGAVLQKTQNLHN